MCNSVNCVRNGDVSDALELWAGGVFDRARYQNEDDRLLDLADGLLDSDKYYTHDDEDIIASGVDIVALATALHYGVLTGKQVGSMLTNLGPDDINTAVLIKLEDAEIEPMGPNDVLSTGAACGGCNCVAA